MQPREAGGGGRAQGGGGGGEAGPGDEMFEWEVDPRDIKLGKLLGSGS